MLGLPPEIQGEIFASAHRDNSDDRALLLPVEVTLTHVCSGWRNIAMNLPILWMAFKFDASPFSDSPLIKLKKYLLRCQSLLKVYLFRSKTKLLELYFDLYDCQEWDSDCDALFAQLLAIAAAHARRWRRFSLFTLTVRSEFIERFEQVNAPNLEYFAMCLGSDLHRIKDPEDIRPSVLIEGAPKLSVIRIDTTSHFHSLPPLSNVTTLTIQDTAEANEHLYSFRTFRSILMIPTLTNLSIESCGPEDLQSLGDPDLLPRIVMPSLKTLRMTEDYDVLGILSLLDAPLLETLVLHDLDLKALYIGHANVDKITPFQNLNTIALLDSYYDRDPSSGDDGFPLVIMMLNKLACCATHIVISSLHNPLWINSDPNLLDFDKHDWPQLKCITLDVSSADGDDPFRFIKNIGRSPHSLTIRVSEPLLEHRSKAESDSWTRLEKICKLEAMKVGDLTMNGYWPVPGGIFHEDGNFPCVRWGESIRTRGPLEFDE
ncbi:hypothetical protein M413DRAFT_246898 [Hebeloma cylindrosporum]|uniref:F-box domain-containing protein n=1 Tax=Hebeloma cylindrosporum TaxID=76867 RepID=A0A0C2XK77_HEBCY|nr:hypothetical protein M413DRAFT_246898 [Hebeloma cylindrosporum h7]